MEVLEEVIRSRGSLIVKQAHQDSTPTKKIKSMVTGIVPPRTIMKGVRCHPAS